MPFSTPRLVWSAWRDFSTHEITNAHGNHRFPCAPGKCFPVRYAGKELERVTRIELAGSALEAQLSYLQRITRVELPVGLQPTISAFEARRDLHLRYGSKFGAADGEPTISTLATSRDARTSLRPHGSSGGTRTRDHPINSRRPTAHIGRLNKVGCGDRSRTDFVGL